MQRTHCSIKGPKHTPGTGLPAPLGGRRGGTSMSPLAPLQKAKSTFPYWHPGAAAAVTPQSTARIRHEFLPRPGQHNTGRFAKWKQRHIQHSANVSRPAPSQSSLPEPGALLSPHHPSCRGSVPGQWAHPSAASHSCRFPNSQYNLPAVRTAITFPVLNWLGQE